MGSHCKEFEDLVQLHLPDIMGSGRCESFSLGYDEKPEQPFVDSSPGSGKDLVAFILREMVVTCTTIVRLYSCLLYFWSRRQFYLYIVYRVARREFKWFAFPELAASHSKPFYLGFRRYIRFYKHAL